MSDDNRPAPWLTRAAVLIATALLPRGVQRDRYRQELRADLRSLPRSRQYRFALGVAVNAFALRRALARQTPLLAADAPPPAFKPLLCRLHLHHVWHTQSTDDGQRYRRCMRCGLDDDGTMPGRFGDHNELVISFFGNRF